MVVLAAFLTMPSAQPQTFLQPPRAAQVGNVGKQTALVTAAAMAAAIESAKRILQRHHLGQRSHCPRQKPLQINRMVLLLLRLLVVLLVVLLLLWVLQVLWMLLALLLLLWVLQVLGMLLLLATVSRTPNARSASSLDKRLDQTLQTLRCHHCRLLVKQRSGLHDWLVI